MLNYWRVIKLFIDVIYSYGAINIITLVVGTKYNRDPKMMG